MFTHEENEILTRVGAGTPMGELFRRFWLPFLLAEELAECDSPPLPVTLLGEKLIAFRNSDGKLGLIERYCPHRRADLFLGRNEQCGLRCAYHGWKFDITGRVVDMPAEPPNSPLKAEVRIKAYGIREWGGLIWAYLGDPIHMPETLPQFEWGLVPARRRVVSKRLQENNYAQTVEGGIDSSHVSILHSRLEPDPALPFRERQKSIVPNVPYFASDTAPRFFVRDADHGFLIGARREASPDEYYWRITQFLVPFYTMIARADGEPVMGHAWTPIDDQNCWAFTMTWHPERDFVDGEVDPLAVHADLLTDGSFRPVANKSNNYLLDRNVQKLHSCTGIQGIGAQDAAIQESMGPIADRTKENLGSSDAAIVAFRKKLIRMARDLQAGIHPIQPAQPDLYKVRSAGIVLKRGVDFRDGAGDRVLVR